MALTATLFGQASGRHAITKRSTRTAAQHSLGERSFAAPVMASCWRLQEKDGIRYGPSKSLIQKRATSSVCRPWFMAIWSTLDRQALSSPRKVGLGRSESAMDRKCGDSTSCPTMASLAQTPGGQIQQRANTAAEISGLP